MLQKHHSKTMMMTSTIIASIVGLFLSTPSIHSFVLSPTSTTNNAIYGIHSLRNLRNNKGTIISSHGIKNNRRINLKSSSSSDTENDTTNPTSTTKNVVIIGAGWAGLSAAQELSKQNRDNNDTKLNITLIDASPRAGGLVRDGFTSMSGKRPAEAGQHGFWDNYHNIFRLLQEDLKDTLDIDDVLTDYAEQGQYSPRGLEAIWPVYREQTPKLPTGLAQALYTKFIKLPVADRLSAGLLVLAFSEFDDSPAAWKKYDSISFRDLCVKLGVTKRCYEEAFEPMILTGLFAPGRECSAAAALGMAYFFVLKGQNAFDVRWCKGNIGELIFEPWVKSLEENGDFKFCSSTRVVGLEANGNDGDEGKITGVVCSSRKGPNFCVDADDVVVAVGASALNSMVRNSPLLSQYSEFRRFANLRGTSVLATRIFLDKVIDTEFSANACWGFDEGIGMTVFDITKLHSGKNDTDSSGSVMEVDFYYSDALNVMDDQSIVDKVKRDLDTIYGESSTNAKVVDAAIVRLPQAVNWYFPGSYSFMPDVKSESISNLYFAGDIVRSRHGSWSQEKAFVTGIEASNAIMGKPIDSGIIPLSADEPHVAFGRNAVSAVQKVLGGGDASRAPSLVDFLW